MKKLSDFQFFIHQENINKISGGSGLTWDGSYSYTWTNTIGLSPKMDATRFDTCFD